MTAAVDWRAWTDDRKRAALDALRDRVAAKRRALWRPYPWQRPHVHPDGWRDGPCDVDCLTLPAVTLPAHGTWLMLGGRGTGKTDAGAQHILDHVNGPPCDTRITGGHRIAIVAPTLGDAAESCVTGPSGLQAHDPRVRLRGGQGGAHVLFANGAQGKLFGAYTPEDVERLRAGGNRCAVWLEEAAAMRHLGPAIEHTRLGLRVGSRPHYVVTTTPKPRAELRALMRDPRTILTRGITARAWHLDPDVRESLYATHRGTRLERQELDGILIEEVAGALWSWRVLDQHRVDVPPPDLKIVVAVDPAASNTPDSDETGIVVAGYDHDTGHGYVLDDLSGRYDPEEWASITVQAVETWDAEYVVAERNQGGDMVSSTIRSADRSTPVRLVTATKGKRLRAEPVSVHYAAGRVHHVGSLTALEEQLTTWTPEDKDSPDRLDALVWALTDLMVTRRGGFADAA